MTSKKILYVVASILLLVTAITIFMPFLLKKDIAEIMRASEIETSEWLQNRAQQYDVIRCEFNLKRPVYVFIYESKFEDLIDYHIHFYEENRDTVFSQNFQSTYTGGTTVTNTTFPELVKMVKKDCEQFKHAKGDFRDMIINWSYSPAPTQEEINSDAVEKLRSDYFDLVPEAREVFDGIYGDPYLASDEEALKIHDRIEKEGGMDERVFIKNKVTIFHNGYPELTDEQKKKIIDTYGEWENLTDKELADYSAAITADIISGKFTVE